MRSYNLKNIGFLSIFTGIILTDSVLSNVSDFLTEQISSSYGLSFFIVTVVAYGVGQYLITSLICRKTISILPGRDINKIDLVVRITQYVLLAIAIIVIIQIIWTSQYSTITIIGSTAVSYALNIALLGILVGRLYSWYSTKRASIIILLYISGFSIAVISSVVAVTEDMYVLYGREHAIKAGTPALFPALGEGTFVSILSDFYHLSSDLSFGLVWISTVLLLKHYRYKLGRLKFWVFVSLPLFYYISTSIDTLGLYTPQTDQDLFLFYLYSSLNSSAGGILFGVSFWAGIKMLPKDNVLKTYMKITAYGLVLLYISSQASLLAAPYPPFGLATVSFYGLSAYLIFLGLDLTAAALAADIRMRTLIKGITIEHAKLLDNMAQSELQSQIENKVAEILKKEIGTTTEIESQSLSQEQLSRYVDQTINEIRKRRM
jgi:hypothetical protein